MADYISATIEAIEKPFLPLTVYRDICLDKRICHGAFHLWHYFHNRKNKNLETWPSNRDIAADLGCKMDSIRGWVTQLQNAGYLIYRTDGPTRRYKYRILAGDGEVSLPEWAKRAALANAALPKMGACKVAPCSPFGGPVLPKQANGAPKNGSTYSNSNGVTEWSEDAPPQFQMVRTGLFPDEYQSLIEQARKEIARIGMDPRYTIPVADQLSAKAYRTIARLESDIKGWDGVEDPSRLPNVERLQKQIEAIRADPNQWRRDLNSKGNALVRVWNARIAEIIDAMNGQIRLPVLQKPRSENEERAHQEVQSQV
jgi:hypothetical protein